MDFMDVNIQVPVEMKLRAGSHFGVGPGGETAYVVINVTHGLCEIVCEIDNGDGTSWVNRLAGQWAFRETDHGVQYFDNFSWKYFPKIVQEQYVGIIAEREILGDSNDICNNSR